MRAYRVRFGEAEFEPIRLVFVERILIEHLDVEEPVGQIAAFAAGRDQIYAWG